MKKLKVIQMSKLTDEPLGFYALVKMLDRLEVQYAYAPYYSDSAEAYIKNGKVYYNAVYTYPQFVHEVDAIYVAVLLNPHNRYSLSPKYLLQIRTDKQTLKKHIAQYYKLLAFA